MSTAVFKLSIVFGAVFTSLNCLPVSAKVNRNSRPPKQPPIYLPTGIDDPRLTRDTYYAKGTRPYQEGLKSKYSTELYRYARKLFQEKKYKQALRIIDLSLANEPPVTLDEATDLHLSICLKLAESANTAESKQYYELALNDCNKGLKGWHPIDYYLPKVDALIGLDRKEDAILCCQTGYNYALGDSRSTEIFSAYLIKLGAAKSPPSELTSKSIQRIRQDMYDMVQRDVCPTQKEIENLFGAPIEVSFRGGPNSIGSIKGGTSLYQHVDLRIPHRITDPSSLTVDVRPEIGAITEEMVRQWFGTKVPKREPSSLTVGLVYQYPWGELEIAFSPFYSKSAYEWTYRWYKSSETDGLIDTAEVPRLTLQEELKAVDQCLDQGDYRLALQKLYWKVSGPADVADVGRLPSKEVRDAVRARLIRWKELEKKPEVVAYLRAACYAELVEAMWQIISCQRTDFFTAKEYAAFPYVLTGQFDKDFHGQCEISGFRGYRVSVINEKTEAAQKLFDLLKIRLPIEKYAGAGMKISPLPGPLLDRIAEEQDILLGKRIAEKEALENARYIEESKNPDIVRQREEEAKRDVLNPTRKIFRDAFK